MFSYLSITDMFKTIISYLGTLLSLHRNHVCRISFCFSSSMSNSYRIFFVPTFLHLIHWRPLQHLQFYEERIAGQGTHQFPTLKCREWFDKMSKIELNLGKKANCNTELKQSLLAEGPERGSNLDQGSCGIYITFADQNAMFLLSFRVKEESYNEGRGQGRRVKWKASQGYWILKLWACPNPGTAKLSSKCQMLQGSYPSKYHL